MLRVVVLGAAAGGGVPQWNCGCAVCRASRMDRPELQSTQSSLAVSVDDAHWFLINASPDIRQQITATKQLHPKPGALRHSPITGVILTNGEVDAVAGLLSLRESSPFTIYAHAQVLAILASNRAENESHRAWKRSTSARFDSSSASERRTDAAGCRTDQQRRLRVSRKRIRSSRTGCSPARCKSLARDCGRK